MDTEARVRALTAAFLDAHREGILGALSESLRPSDSTRLFPVHRTLFDVVKMEVRDPDPRHTVAGVHGALATDDANVTANQTTRNEVNGVGGSGADQDNNGPKTPAGAVTMNG